MRLLQSFGVVVERRCWSPPRLVRLFVRNSAHATWLRPLNGGGDSTHRTRTVLDLFGRIDTAFMALWRPVQRLGPLYTSQPTCCSGPSGNSIIAHCETNLPISTRPPKTTCPSNAILNFDMERTLTPISRWQPTRIVSVSAIFPIFDHPCHVTMDLKIDTQQTFFTVGQMQEH